MEVTKNEIILGEESFPLFDSLHSASRFFYVEESGLTLSTQSALVFHRRGLGSEQIVYQIAPGVRPVIFKEEEGSDDDYTTEYSLAFPWVILCISYEKENFMGVRHFYSPEPIFNLDQQLYVPNLPNTNTSRYNSTSVGWVCLYHNAAGNNLTPLTRRLSYALARHDPYGEPYNYANMSETDGIHFYSSVKLNSLLSTPDAWANKTKSDGWAWTLEPDLYEPFLIDPEDTYAESYDSQGQPYTLRQALYNPHYCYYETVGAELLNQFTSLDEDDRKELVTSNVRKAVLYTKNQSIQSSPAKDFSFSFSFTQKHLSFKQTVYCYSCGRVEDFPRPFTPNYLTITSQTRVASSPIAYNGYITYNTSFGATYFCHECRRSEYTFSTKTDNIQRAGSHLNNYNTAPALFTEEERYDHHSHSSEASPLYYPYKLERLVIPNVFPFSKLGNSICFNPLTHNHPNYVYVQPSYVDGWTKETCENCGQNHHSYMGDMSFLAYYESSDQKKYCMHCRPEGLQFSPWTCLDFDGVLRNRILHPSTSNSVMSSENPVASVTVHQNIFNIDAGNIFSKISNFMLKTYEAACNLKLIHNVEDQPGVYEETESFVVYLYRDHFDFLNIPNTAFASGPGVTHSLLPNFSVAHEDFFYEEDLFTHVARSLDLI